MNKKGLSPFIGTVLLVAIVIAMVLLIMPWITRTINLQSEKECVKEEKVFDLETRECEEIVKKCRNVSFKDKKGEEFTCYDCLGVNETFYCNGLGDITDIKKVCMSEDAYGLCYYYKETLDLQLICEKVASIDFKFTNPFCGGEYTIYGMMNEPSIKDNLIDCICWKVVESKCIKYQDTKHTKKKCIEYDYNDRDKMRIQADTMKSFVVDKWEGLI